MKTYQHKGTGAIIMITEINDESFKGIVIANPKNSRVVVVGDHISSTVDRIGTQWIKTAFYKK